MALKSGDEIYLERSEVEEELREGYRTIHSTGAAEPSDTGKLLGQVREGKQLDQVRLLDYTQLAYELGTYKIYLRERHQKFTWLHLLKIFIFPII